MKFRYTGTPGENLDEITMYDTHFPRGKWVDVHSPFAVRKLSGHPHFESKGGDVTDVEVKAQGEELQRLTAAALEPLEAEKALKDNPHGDDARSTGNASSAKARNRRSE